QLMMGESTKITNDSGRQVSLQELQWRNGLVFSGTHVHKQELEGPRPVRGPNFDRLNPPHALQVLDDVMTTRKGREQRRAVCFNNRRDFADQRGRFPTANGRMALTCDRNAFTQSSQKDFPA